MMQCQAVLAPGGNRHHSAEHWHLNRQFLLGGGAVAELPLLFQPQARTVPSALRAKLCAPPAAMAMTRSRLWTSPGVGRDLTVPSPSWPVVLKPHDQTLPPTSRARLWLLPSPASIATILLSPLTLTGF